jgi:hypothetical protein
MEIDCINRLSDRKKQEYMKKGQCFKCGEHGHRENDPAYHPKNGDARKNTYGKSQVRHETPDDEN